MAIQVPSPPNLRVLSSIVSFFPITQALIHPKMRFSGWRPTEFPFIHPPATKQCRRWVFPPRESGMAIQVRTPPNRTDQNVMRRKEEGARRKRITRHILKTTQNYRFTSQVYSTFPFLVHLSPDFVLPISLH